MEPEQANTQDRTLVRENVFFRVTRLSKYLAMALFIVLPFVGGYIGYNYASEKVENVKSTSATFSVQNDEEHSADAILQQEKSPSYDLSKLVLTGECIKSLYSQDMALYDTWEEVFTKNFPEFDIYDANSMCSFENGYHLVSFSFFKKDFKGEWNGIEKANAGQSLVLFDENNEVAASTDNLFVDTAGDLGSPDILQVGNGHVLFSLGGGDAGILHTSYFILDLEDFTFDEIVGFYVEYGVNIATFTINGIRTNFDANETLTTNIEITGPHTLLFELLGDTEEALFSNVFVF